MGGGIERWVLVSWCRLSFFLLSSGHQDLSLLLSCCCCRLRWRRKTSKQSLLLVLFLLLFFFEFRLELFTCSVLPSMLLCNVVYLETENLGLVTFGRLCRHVGWMHLEKHMREGCAKVSAVDRCVACWFRVVNIFATWAIQLDSLGHRHIRQTNRQQWLQVAQYSRATSKFCLFVLVQLYIFSQREHHTGFTHTYLTSLPSLLDRE